MNKIVAAVGLSANALDPANRPRAQHIEQAMSQAVREATAEGVTDPAEIKRRLMTARASLLADAAA